MGYNYYGKLCVQSNDSVVYSPWLIALSNIEQIRGSNYHTVLLSDEKAYACGENIQSSFGGLDHTRYFTPVQISSNDQIVLEVAATDDGTYLLTTEALLSAGFD